MSGLISIVMANYNGAAHIGAAIASVQGQSLTGWELIIADDGSQDDSAAIVTAAAAQDARIRLLTATAPGGGPGGGPGAARNRALEVARGDWIAICDSDDLMHPDRLARLHHVALAQKADLVADDMVFFGATPGTGGRTLLQPLALRAPMAVSAELWLRASQGENDLPPLGYLKPLIRAARLGGLRYDTGLRVGEDFDLVLRLLLAGAQFTLLPDPLYLYRRHEGSVSHRLSVPLVEAMIAAQARLPAQTDGQTGAQRDALADALAARAAELERMLGFERLVAALKTRRPGAALAELARRPALAARLGRSLTEGLARRLRPAGRPTGRPDLRPDLALRLDGSQAGAPEIPPLPAPGAEWAAPPAPAMARLGALAEAHQLQITPPEGARCWINWHVQQLQKALS